MSDPSPATASGPPEEAPDAEAEPQQQLAERQPRQFGCLAKVLVFVAMVALGGWAAATIRGNDGKSATTIEKGKVGKVSWEVQASVDEQQSRCVQLYANGTTAEDQITGGCIPSRGQATGDDVHEAELPGTRRWVVFGQAPKSTRKVTLHLTDGSTRSLALSDKTTDQDGYYVWVAPEGVHTNGPAAFS